MIIKTLIIAVSTILLVFIELGLLNKVAKVSIANYVVQAIKKSRKKYGKHARKGNKKELSIRNNR